MDETQDEPPVLRAPYYNINPSYIGHAGRKPDLPGRLMRWILDPDTVLSKVNSVVQNGFALAMRVREDLIRSGAAFSDALDEQYNIIAMDFDYLSEEIDMLKTLTRNMSMFELKKRSGRMTVRAAEFDYKIKSFSHSTLKAMNRHRRDVDIEKENARAIGPEDVGTGDDGSRQSK